MIPSEDRIPLGNITKSNPWLNRPRAHPATKAYDSSSVSRLGNASTHLEMVKNEQHQDISHSIGKKKPTPPAELIKVKENMEESERISLESKIRASIKNYPLRHTDNSQNSVETKRDPAIIAQGVAKRRPKYASVNWTRHDDPKDGVQECLKIIDHLKKNDVKKLQVLRAALKEETSLPSAESTSELATPSSGKEDIKDTESTVPRCGSAFNPNAPEFYSHRGMFPSEQGPVYTMSQTEMLPSQVILPGKYPPRLFQHQPFQQEMYQYVGIPSTQNWLIRDSHCQINHQYQYENTRQWNRPQSATNHVQPALSDEGHGHVTYVLDHVYARSLMASFKKGFPLTGELKAVPQIDGRKRHATTIQQRLEYLLWRQKEAKAPQKLSKVQN
ncbi:hypothetical protein B7463_g4467, partial [Scytalidium lignicola]